MPVTGGRSNARHPSVKTVGPVRHKPPKYDRFEGRGCAGAWQRSTGAGVRSLRYVPRTARASGRDEGWSRWGPWWARVLLPVIPIPACMEKDVEWGCSNRR